MDIISLNPENIADQHICCAFSDKKCREGYEAKKTWLKSAFREGYQFRRLDARGKVFIEYVPIEKAWLPLQGSNFMVINCFWVSGKFKGQGIGRRLVSQCLEDAAGMDGVVAISSDKKRPYMSDPRFFKHHGFEVIDEAPPYFKLYGLRTNPNASWPQILPSAKSGRSPDTEGLSVYYSDTCPFNAYYTETWLQEYAAEKGVPLQLHHLPDREAARQVPVPWIIHSIFYQGELVTLAHKDKKKLDAALAGGS